MIYKQKALSNKIVAHYLFHDHIHHGVDVLLGDIPVAVDVGIGEVEALTGLAVLRVDHLHQVGSVHLAVMVDVV